MNETIKLTEDNFNFIHWEKDSGGLETFELTSYGESESHCNEIKQQILKNQEIVEKLKSNYEYYNKLIKICENDDIITTNPTHFTHLKAQHNLLKEILGDEK